MKNITALIALSALTTGALSAQNTERGPRGERPPLEEIVPHLIEQCDTDGSHSLDLAEFEEALKAHRKHMQRNAPRGPGGPNAMGQRPPREERGMGNRPPPRPEQISRMKERVGHIFAKADLDASGTLDEAELIDAMSSMRPMRPRGQRGPVKD